LRTVKSKHFSEILQKNDMYRMAEFFKVLGNPTRIHILLLLMERDTCVSELADRLCYTQSAVSHQLNILKSNKLIRQRREGKMIFYTITNQNVKLAIEKGMEYILQK